MTKRVLFLIACALIVSTTAFSQTEDELKAEKAEKAEQVKALQGQIDALNGEIAGIDAKFVRMAKMGERRIWRARYGFHWLQ